MIEQPQELQPGRPPASEDDKSPSRGRQIVGRLLLVGWRPPWLLPLAVGVLAGIVAVLAVQCAAGQGVYAPALPAGTVDSAPDLTLVFSPGVLTALVSQSISQGNAPLHLQNVQVRTDSQRLVVLGDVPIVGHSVGGSVEMQPHVQNGELHMRVLRAKFGLLPVPGDVGRVAETPINAYLDAILTKLPATITSAHTGPEGLTLTARVRVQDLIKQGG